MDLSKTGSQCAVDPLFGFVQPSVSILFGLDMSLSSHPLTSGQLAARNQLVGKRIYRFLEQERHVEDNTVVMEGACAIDESCSLRFRSAYPNHLYSGRSCSTGSSFKHLSRLIGKYMHCMIDEYRVAEERTVG